MIPEMEEQFIKDQNFRIIEEKERRARLKKKKEKKPKINLTDPDSKIMKTSGEVFQESDNAQIAVDKESQFIVVK